MGDFSMQSSSAMTFVSVGRSANGSNKTGVSKNGC